MKDKYGESGSPAELVEHFGMGTTAIIEAIRRAVDRKQK